jgi:site-specific DNA-methyltransferase (adenine-specific)
MTVNIYNADCMVEMAKMKDGEFELAIVDPPYGIGQDWKKRTGNRINLFKETSYKNESIPDEKYFQEIFRTSKNQIIWGYNYYTKYLGSTNYLIIWDKMSSNNPVFHYSKCEIAYTSIKIPANLISLQWDGYRMGSETGVSKIHPHQKPVALYQWLLKNYAKQGDRILDTHGGSCSSAIACDIMGFDATIFEIDKDYYEAALDRFNRHKQQLVMEF